MKISIRQFFTTFLALKTTKGPLFLQMPQKIKELSFIKHCKRRGEKIQQKIVQIIQEFLTNVFNFERKKKVTFY
jgi:ABC-type hemin transport system substrate-binding protein